MTKKEYATSKGITVEQLNRESYAFLQCEGYDDNGNEYETLDAWLDRNKSAKAIRSMMQTADPIDGVQGGGPADGQYIAEV